MNFKKLTYLCMQRLTNFPYIEEDFDALTNYELLSKVVEYLNKVIANDNLQNEAITELANSFIELKNYVDNLDLQDEVNNKLDEMYENGQLADLVAQYLGIAGLITFDTVADMKNAENLVNGSKCKTLGFYSVNDGGSASYKIRTVTNEDDVNEMNIIALYDNSLVAELIYENPLNVLKLGAKGDGTSDDTDCLQLASDLSSSKNLSILIPEKHFVINDKITITNNVDFKGLSWNSIIEQKAQFKSIFECLTTIDKPTFENMYLYGVVAPDASPNEYERSCLWLCGCTNGYFSHIKFGTSDDSHITLRYSLKEDTTLNLSDNNQILNCEFTNCTEGSPIELFYAKNTDIQNCYFHDNNLNSVRWSIRMIQADHANVLNCKFINDYIGLYIGEGSIDLSPNYPLIQSNHITIDKCKFYGLRHGCIINKGSDIVISNCYFDRKTVTHGGCIELSYNNSGVANIPVYVSNVTVKNNTFIDFDICITMYDYQYNTNIDNNIFINDYTADRMYCVRVDTFANSTYTSIKNNTVYSDVKIHLTRTTTGSETAKCDMINNTIYSSVTLTGYPLLYSANSSYYIAGNVANHAVISQ